MSASIEDLARDLFLANCQLGDRGALERHGEKAAVSAIVQAISLNKQILADLLYAEMSGAYDCTRVWSAWGYGTMSEDDFTPVAERVDEMAAGIVECHIAALAAAKGENA